MPGVLYMRSKTDVSTGIILLGLCGIGAWSVSQIPDTLEGIGPASFPKAIIIILAVLSLALTIKGFFSAGRHKWPEKEILKKTFYFILLFLAYLGGIIWLGDFFANMENPPFHSGMGFSISTFLFLVLALPLLNRRRPLEVILVAVLTTLALVFVFGSFFQVVLP